MYVCDILVDLWFGLMFCLCYCQLCLRLNVCINYHVFSLVFICTCMWYFGWSLIWFVLFCQCYHQLYFRLNALIILFSYVCMWYFGWSLIWFDFGFICLKVKKTTNVCIRDQGNEYCLFIVIMIWMISLLKWLIKEHRRCLLSVYVKLHLFIFGSILILFYALHSLFDINFIIKKLSILNIYSMLPIAIVLKLDKGQRYIVYSKHMYNGSNVLNMIWTFYHCTCLISL